MTPSIRKTADAKLSAVWEKYGAFFAFGQQQFNEQRKPGVTYSDVLGNGLICPTEHCATVLHEMQIIQDEAVAAELAITSPRQLIWRELANHETQLTGDITDACGAVAMYGITTEQVQEVWPDYYNHCCEHDIF